MAYVGNTLRVNPSDTLNLSGGTLRFSNFVKFASGTLNYTGGNIQIPYLSNQALGSDPTLATFFGSSPVIPTGKGLIFETLGGYNQVHNSVSVNGGLLKSGGEIVIGSVEAAGNLAVSNGGDVDIRLNSYVGVQQTGVLSVTGAGSTYSTGGLSVYNAGTVTVQNSALLSTNNLYVSGTLNFSGGTVRMNMYQRAGSGQFNFNYGTIQLAGDRTLGTDTLVAEFFGAGPLTIPIFKGLTVEGTATMQPSLPVTLAGSLSAGTLLMNPGSRLATTGGSVTTAAVLALAGSTIDATSASLTIGDSTKVNGFYCNGTLAVGSNGVLLRDANDAVFDSAALVALGIGATPGSLGADNGLTLDFGGNITGYGTVTTPNNIAKPLINNGHIIGASAAQRITLPGYVKGVGTLDNVTVTGTLSPGLSPTATMAGNLAFSPTSALIMELGGTVAGSQYDQIIASGELGFDGALQVALIGGFAPSAGQSFNLFDWASVTGTFDALSLPVLTGGLTWNTSQLYTTGVLSVASAGIAGDYNNNGTVDAGDYVAWRKSQGTNTVLPNDPTGGTIGAAQYNTWRTNFGKPPGSGAGTDLASTTVPEPAGASFLLLTAMLWFACCHPQWNNRQM